MEKLNIIQPEADHKGSQTKQEKSEARQRQWEKKRAKERNLY